MYVSRMCPYDSPTKGYQPPNMINFHLWAYDHLQVACVNRRRAMHPTAWTILYDVPIQGTKVPCVKSFLHAPKVKKLPSSLVCQSHR
jgi:hypothetical protein